MSVSRISTRLYVVKKIPAKLGIHANKHTEYKKQHTAFKSTPQPNWNTEKMEKSIEGIECFNAHFTQCFPNLFDVNISCELWNYLADFFRT